MGLFKEKVKKIENGKRLSKEKIKLGQITEGEKRIVEFYEALPSEWIREKIEIPLKIEWLLRGKFSV